MNEERERENIVSSADGMMKEEEILKATKLGLWVIEVDTNTNKNRMFVNESMREVLGVEEPLSGEAYYEHWYSNINDGYYDYVSSAVEKIMETGEIIEVEYTWNHPKRGEVPVRCVGVLSQFENGVYTLKGYHRIVEDMIQVHFLESNNYEMFEYNEVKRTIYFHTNRAIIYGEEGREADFPNCWIRQNMIHPYFIKAFRDIFYSVRKKRENKSLDLLMKAKRGEFEWFRLETHHIGNEKQDLNTLIISLHPIAENQTLQLQYVRKVDFYQAILSTTAAYAEVDLNTGMLQSSGGLWADYMTIGAEENLDFRELIERYMPHAVDEADYKTYRQMLDIEFMKLSYGEEKATKSFQFQRKFPDGSRRWMELIIHIFQEQVTENMYALLYLKDIDAQRKHQLEQELAASRDPLTQVLNRRVFEQRFLNYIQSDTPEAENCALVIFDVDNFKQINDTKGHQEGDEVLKKFAALLLTYFGETGYVGRFGGDEFIVFIRNNKSRERLTEDLHELSEELQQISSIPVFFSAGIYLTSKRAFDYKAAMKRADAALYDSKRRGKNTLTYWED